MVTDGGKRHKSRKTGKIKIRKGEKKGTEQKVSDSMCGETGSPDD